MATRVRDQVSSIVQGRVTAAERAYLDELAEQMDSNFSAALRQAIHDSFQVRNGHQDVAGRTLGGTPSMQAPSFGALEEMHQHAEVIRGVLLDDQVDDVDELAGV